VSGVDSVAQRLLDLPALRAELPVRLAYRLLLAVNLSPRQPSSLPAPHAGWCSTQTSLAGDGRASVARRATALAFHLCRTGYKPRLNSQVKIGFGNFILVSAPFYHDNGYAGGHDCQFCSETLQGWGGALDIAS